MKYITTIGEKQFLVEIIDDRHVSVDGKVYEVDFESVSGQPVAPGDDNWQVLLRGRLFPVTVEDERERRLRAAAGGGVAETGEYLLKSPMPGLVVAILLEEGQEVKKGQVLLILESMKMQNELKSPRDGIVHRIKVKAGDTVEQRQTLLSVM
jgi:acetyl/propionyl-CoA carboxylase alpha subunit